MNRRKYIAVTTGAVLSTGLAGCLGNGADNGDTPEANSDDDLQVDELYQILNLTPSILFSGDQYTIEAELISAMQESFSYTLDVSSDSVSLSATTGEIDAGDLEPFAEEYVATVEFGLDATEVIFEDDEDSKTIDIELYVEDELQHSSPLIIGSDEIEEHETEEDDAEDDELMYRFDSIIPAAVEFEDQHMIDVNIGTFSQEAFSYQVTVINDSTDEVVVEETGQASEADLELIGDEYFKTVAITLDTTEPNFDPSEGLEYARVEIYVENEFVDYRLLTVIG